MRKSILKRWPNAALIQKIGRSSGEAWRCSKVKVKVLGMIVVRMIVAPHECVKPTFL